MHSGYVRGAVSGLGVINVIIGCLEIMDFKRTVSAISDEKQADEPTINLLDNRPTDSQN